MLNNSGAVIREKAYLGRRYSAILASVGAILMLSGAVMLFPLLVVFAYPDETRHAAAFIFPAAGVCISGLLLRRLFRPDPRFTLSVQEGGVIVFIGWVAVMVVSAWPFMAVLDLPFSRAFFESVSGWTTTGLSVVDLARAGPMILFWRSIIQLIGGAGLAIIMMSAIVGPTGVGISNAEGRSDQLLPQVRRSSRLVILIYFCYAAAGTLAYRLAGMSLFDAVNHAFCAVSTGGFSTRVESIGHWNAVAVEAVTLTLMVLGNLSFVTAWFLWRGQFRVVARNGEVRLFTLLSVLSAAALFLFTAHALYPRLGKGLRVAVFESISALTTTGYSTVGYGDWNGFGMLLLIALMLVGGGTCSTAGGVKQFRVHLLARLIVWEFRRAIMPKSAVLERPIWEGRQQVFVDDARVRQVAVFVFLYMTAYLLGALILCACGYDLADALFEFASAIGTVGLSVGVTAPDMPDATLWAETIAMFLGRLEFIVVFASLLKIGKDARRVMFFKKNGKSK